MTWTTACILDKLTNFMRFSGFHEIYKRLLSWRFGKMALVFFCPTGDGWRTITTEQFGPENPGLSREREVSARLRLGEGAGLMLLGSGVFARSLTSSSTTGCGCGTTRDDFALGFSLLEGLDRFALVTGSDSCPPATVARPAGRD